MPPANPDSARAGMPAWLLLLTVAGTGVACFWYRGDYVTAASLAAVTFVGASAYRLGAIRAAGLLGGFALACLCAPSWSGSLEPRCAAWFGTSGQINRMLSIGIVGTSLMLVVALSASVVAARLTKERPRLAAWNCWLGCGLGTLEGLGLVLLVLSGLRLVEPFARDRLAAPQGAPGNGAWGRVVAAKVVEVTRRTRNSAIGPWIAAWDPFEHVPPLREFRRRVAVLSDPQCREQLMRQYVQSASSPHPAGERSVSARELSELLGFEAGDFQRMERELMNGLRVQELLKEKMERR